MAISPPAPAGGTYRVVRIESRVTEAYITAGSVAAARAAARVLPASGWTKRTVLQTDRTQDIFEYDVVQGDDGT